MRGRKPKPTSQKELEGNPGGRPLNEDEPQHEAPAATFDDAPAELAGDTRAAAEWRRLVPLLRRARQVCEADRAALIALCLEFSRYVEASLAIKGMIVRLPSGHPVTNPYILVSQRSLSMCLKLWAELGLTPSSRSRVTRVSGFGDEPPQDDFSEFDVEPIH